MPNGVTGRRFQAVSPTIDPAFSELLDRILGGIPQLPPPTEALGQFGPLLSLILGPLLQAQRPAEEEARQAVVSAFRGAGALGGTPFAQAVTGTEADILGARGQLTARTAAQTLGPLLQFIIQSGAQQFLPIEAMTAILQQIAPQIFDVTPAPTPTRGERLPSIFEPGGGPLRPKKTDREPADSPLKDMLDEIALGGLGGADGGGFVVPPSPEPAGPPSPNIGGAIAFNPFTGQFESTAGAQKFPIVPESDPFGLFDFDFAEGL